MKAFSFAGAPLRSASHHLHQGLHPINLNYLELQIDLTKPHYKAHELEHGITQKNSTWCYTKDVSTSKQSQSIQDQKV